MLNRHPPGQQSQLRRGQTEQTHHVTSLINPGPRVRVPPLQKFFIPLFFYPLPHNCQFIFISITDDLGNYAVMSGLQHLIDFVLNEVALCGDQGVYSLFTETHFPSPRRRMSYVLAPASLQLVRYNASRFPTAIPFRAAYNTPTRGDCCTNILSIKEPRHLLPLSEQNFKAPIYY